MLSGATRISQQTLSAAPARHALPSSKRIDRSTTKLLPGGSYTANRAREHILTQASFLDTLVSGGSPAKTGNRQQAEELVDQLLKLTGRGSKPKIGPDEDIDQIIDELRRLSSAKNALRSPLLSDRWNVRYLSRRSIPPFATNPVITLTELTEFDEGYGGTVFGVFPSKFGRSGNIKVAGQNAFRLCVDRYVVDKGLFGVERKDADEGQETLCELLYLDERVLMLFRGKSENGKRVGDPVLQVFERNATTANENPTVGQSAKSNAGVSGLSNIAPKASMTKEAGRSTNERRVVDSNGGNSIAVANREAKKEALRLKKEKEVAEREAAKASAEREAAKKKAAAEKEKARMKVTEEREAAKQKAAAEKEAADALRAEIKASVDAFNQIVRNAQEGKKLATAALRDFEKENSGILKDAKAFKQEQESIDGQIASLQDEIVVLAGEEKARAQEVKDSRRAVTDLERKYATL